MLVPKDDTANATVTSVPLSAEVRAPICLRPFLAIFYSKKKIRAITRVYFKFHHLNSFLLIILTPTVKYTLVIARIFFFTIENPIELLIFTMSQKNAYYSKTVNNTHPNFLYVFEEY